MSKSQQKMFITGGAGFIGSHLVETFLDEGHQVTVYDNLSVAGGNRITHLIGREGLRFIQADLLDLPTLQEAMAGHDVVWHLGANGDIPGGNQNPEIQVKNTLLTTHHVLEAMRRNGIRPILFPSSSTVYGEPEVYPTPENAGPMLPLSIYGAAKLGSEGLVSAYCHLFGLQGWIFRFGNVEGARMDHGVIYDFIQKLRRNPKELEILGDGEQKKNFLLVEDCIAGMRFVLQRVRGKECDVFNLGSATTIKVTEIARIVVEEMGLGDVRFRYTGGKRGWPGDVPIVIYDVGKMRKLGWQTKHTSAGAVRIATRRLLGKE